MQNIKTMELFIELSSANSSIQKKLDRYLGPVHGIGISEFRALRELAKAPSHCMSRIELADQVGLTASGVTRLLNPMEKVGLITKKPNQRDARVSLVKLTDTGKQRFDEALDGFVHIMEDSLKKLTHTEQDHLVDLLSKLT